MFEDSLVESRVGHVSASTRWTTFASISLQCALAGLVIALPLLHPEALSVPRGCSAGADAAASQASGAGGADAASRGFLCYRALAAPAATQRICCRRCRMARDRLQRTCRR